MADGEQNLPPRAGALVGYGKPPEQHRFRKGVSGNPRGRPPKAAHAKPRRPSPTQMEDVLLAEAMRPIQIRENDRLIEIPMIQAVIRSMGIAAVKGSHRSQTTLANMVQAVQAKRFEDLRDLFRSAIEYKDRWQEEFDECDRLGLPRPEPVPHPHEVILNSNTLEVKFNGPVSPDDKAHWDMLLERRQDSLKGIAENRRLLKRKPKYSSFLAEDIAREQRLADMIGGILPDEKTRRQPGFDLIEWRERNGVLAELRKERGQKRRTR